MNKFKDDLNQRQLLDESTEDYAASVGNPFFNLKKTNLVEKIIHEKEAKKIIDQITKKLEPFRYIKRQSIDLKVKEELKLY